ncbi:hypothetical protein [Jiella avicenniae]|uniref:Uncharacterized protein n=1 Tax=Jiella avicenniae TaxID=2907202 RepID=A0A9X1NZ12_9HYPH|nr:hypothetical protein [Jiella avicenniae]MCE7028410.1 hypothetical protein [Jiella avicenniae]
MKCLLSALMVCLAPTLVIAMEFRFDGEAIRATGAIEKGDADRFAATVAPSIDGPLFTVSFDSPGGSLLEGMRLGEAIHAADAGTMVERGKNCLSACAIAFLGGKTFGSYAHQVRREIEPGARLGYHGFFSGRRDQVELVNEVLDQSRLVNALLLDYATRMRGVDGGLLSRLLTTAPAEMELIDTPAEIAGLGITLLGDPLPLPEDWPTLACRNAVQRMIGAFADAKPLVGPGAKRTASLEALRRQMLDDKYPANADAGAIRSALAGLAPGDAIDLMVGEPVYADPENPPVRVPLSQGGGFLGNACYAMADASFVTTIVVDGIDRKATLRQDDPLFAYDPDRPLW